MTSQENNTLLERLRKLQNGSDIRGIACSGIEGEVPNLLRRETQALATAFVSFLTERSQTDVARPLSVAVGRDSRVTGPLLQEIFLETLRHLGVIAIDCAMASTPAMFMATQFSDFACDGAVMITASHLPFNRNGFKFFTKEGGLQKEDITYLVEKAASLYPMERADWTYPEATADSRYPAEKAAPLYPAEKATSLYPIDEGPIGANQIGMGLAEDCPVREGDEKALWETDLAEMNRAVASYSPDDAPIQSELMKAYCAFLRNKIKEDTGEQEEPLRGLHIVVDSGNGAGGFYAAQVLAPLGADVTGSLYLCPDGTFPNHTPNPEDKKAMVEIRRAVLENQADLGLIFDTDVDRSAAVTAAGREVARNGIVALAAVIAAQGHPGATIVTDSITSTQLTAFLEDTLGLSHLRFQRGYKNVINKALELNAEGTDCPLAIETSGHAALRENYFLDDGAYLATKIVIQAANLAKEGRTIEDLLAALKEPIEATEVRLKIRAKDYSALGDAVLQSLEKEASNKAGRSSGLTAKEVSPNYEGVRLNFWENGRQFGWCLLRKSLHDPLLPLNIEADEEGGVAKIAAAIYPILSRFADLDTAPLASLR